MLGYFSKYRSDEMGRQPTWNPGLLRLVRQTALAVILTGLISGCGSAPKFEPVPCRTIADFHYRTILDGLEVAVDPYTDRDRVETHFGINLLSHQIVPFEVMFANREAQGGFLLQPGLVTFLDERGLEEVKPVSSDTIMPPGWNPSGAVGVTSILFPLPGLIFSLVAADPYLDTIDISRNMESMLFLDKPMYPSDSNRGFLYVKFANIGDIPKVAAVMFRVKNVRTKQEKIVIVLLKRR